MRLARSKVTLPVPLALTLALLARSKATEAAPPTPTPSPLTPTPTPNPHPNSHPDPTPNPNPTPTPNQVAKTARKARQSIVGAQAAGTEKRKKRRESCRQDRESRRATGEWDAGSNSNPTP